MTRVDADVLPGDAEQAEAVDHDRDRELAGDHDGGQAARAERAHGDERDRHVDRAEQAADERPPRRSADVRRASRARRARTRATSTQHGGADEKREGRRLHAPDDFAQARVDRRLHADEAAGADAEQHRQPAAHRAPLRELTSPPASSRPTPTSTASGGSRSHTPHISRSISARAASASSGGPSNSSSSWIVSSRRVRRSGLAPAPRGSGPSRA